jgi:hypothetical protein
VIIYGSAGGVNFRRYVLEWRADASQTYQQIAESFLNVPLGSGLGGELGRFDSDSVPPGLYWFRLQVFDGQGGLTAECAIRLRFL